MPKVALVSITYLETYELKDLGLDETATNKEICDAAEELTKQYYNALGLESGYWYNDIEVNISEE